MVQFLEENSLFNSGQHGFRKGRSCLSELLAHFDEILDGLNSGANVDVVYLDFAKATKSISMSYYRSFIRLEYVENCTVGLNPFLQIAHCM